MKKLIFALALLWPTGAWAQCNGIFPANTLCGNLGGSPAPPAAFSASGTVTGPTSSAIGDVAIWANTGGTQLKDLTTPPNQVLISSTSSIPTWATTFPIGMTAPALTVTGSLTILNSPSYIADTGNLALGDTSPIPPFRRLQALYNGVANEVFTWQVSRAASYNTLGPSGNLNTVYTFGDTPGLTNGDAEWTVLAQMTNNSSTSTGNVALYAQALKKSVSPTWAFINEIQDINANSTQAAVAQEITYSGNGNDNNFSRVGIDLSVGPGAIAGATTPTVLSYGYRIDAQNGVAANAHVRLAYSVDNATFEYILRANSSGATIQTAGVDFSLATFLGGAVAFKSPGFVVDSSGNLASELTSVWTLSTTAPRTTTSSTYTVGTSDYSIIVNVASGNTSLTMPAPATNTGRWLIVKTTQAQPVTSITSNVVAITGGTAGTSILAGTSGKFVGLQSDGTNWITMMGN